MSIRGRRMWIGGWLAAKIISGSPKSAEYAKFLKWNYDEITGDPVLIQDLVDGCWDAERFLTVQPGQKIEEDVTRPGIIKSE